MEPSVAKYVCRHPLAWGKHHGGEAMDCGLRLHICGHHRRASVTVFGKRRKPVIEPHSDPFKDNMISLDNDQNPPSMRQV